MKDVASRFVCGTGTLKTAVRAEISTETVTFIHCLAAAEVASSANEPMDSAYIVRICFESKKRAGSNGKKKCLRMRRRHDISDGELEMCRRQN